MNRTLIRCGWLLLLAAPPGASAETSWLEAEVRAQEARWAARRGRAAPLAPAGIAPGTAAPARDGEARTRAKPPALPPVAARSVPAPATTEAGPPPRARPAGAGDLARTILAAAGRHGVDPLLVKAVILAESGGRRWATSPKGAMGLMQLMPATARRFGVADPFDPAQNVAGGTRYLRWLLDRFGGDVTLALAGYNAGEGAVERHGGVPPYRETRNYVRAVQSNHRLLRRRLAERLAERAR